MHNTYPQCFERAGWPKYAKYADGSPALLSVGLFEPNSRGIYDMAGNVIEWVWETYEPFTNQQATDAAGTGATRAGRGGAWTNPALFVRI